MRLHLFKITKWCHRMELQKLQKLLCLCTEVLCQQLCPSTIVFTLCLRRATSTASCVCLSTTISPRNTF